jgi:hypothetical protein
MKWIAAAVATALVASLAAAFTSGTSWIESWVSDAWNNTPPIEVAYVPPEPLITSPSATTTTSARRDARTGLPIWTAFLPRPAATGPA